MGAPKKYRDKYVTTISMERQEKEIADVLGILLSDALRLGLNFAIKMRIVDDDRRITPEILEQFAEIEKRDLLDLQAYIRLKSHEQQTLDKILELKKEAQKEDELIEVYDRGEEAYIRIPKSQFNLEWHTIRSTA